MEHYRLATLEDIPSITKLLSNGFKDYPLFTLVTNHSDKHLEILESLFLVLTRTYIKLYSCLVMTDHGKIIAVALLKPQDKKDPSLFSYLRAGGLSFIVKNGVRQTARLFSLEEQSLKPINDLAQPHWHLEAFVVSKEAQGKKIGSNFLQNFLIPFISNNQGGLLTLVTNTEINQTFYQRNGFTEFSEILLKLKDKQLKNWSFYLNIDSSDK